jgi:hypothetical protein
MEEYLEIIERDSDSSSLLEDEADEFPDDDEADPDPDEDVDEYPVC